jgi:hypothetical protein
MIGFITHASAVLAIIHFWPALMLVACVDCGVDTQADITQVINMAHDPSVGEGGCFRGTIVTAKTVGEEFHVSPFPRSPEFWKHVAQSGIQIAIQFQEGAPPGYHAEKVGAPFVSFNKSPIVTTTVVLTSDEAEYGMRHRKYMLEETTTASNGEQSVTARFLHHLQIYWPDFGLPDPKAFDVLFGRYLSLLKDATVPCPGSSGAADVDVPLGSGCRVFVHCLGGYGRSGTFVFARVLHGATKWTDAEAETLLDELRKQRYLVETDAQKAFAKAAARRIGSASA